MSVDPTAAASAAAATAAAPSSNRRRRRMPNNMASDPTSPFFRETIDSLPDYTKKVHELQIKYARAIQFMEKVKRTRQYRNYMKYLHALPKADLVGGGFKERIAFSNSQDRYDMIRDLRDKPEYKEAITFMNEIKLNPLYKQYQQYLRELPKKNKFVYTGPGRQMVRDLIYDAGLSAIAEDPERWAAKLQRRKNKLRDDEEFPRKIKKFNELDRALSTISVPAAKERRLDEDVYVRKFKRMWGDSDEYFADVSDRLPSYIRRKKPHKDWRPNLQRKYNPEYNTLDDDDEEAANILLTLDDNNGAPSPSSPPPAADAGLRDARNRVLASLRERFNHVEAPQNLRMEIEDEEPQHPQQQQQQQQQQPIIRIRIPQQQQKKNGRRKRKTKYDFRTGKPKR